MDARTLLAWGDLEERRRRAARSGIGRFSPWFFSGFAGLGLALLVARSAGVLGERFAQDATPQAASRLWLAALIASNVVVIFSASFRLYWRHDSSLLSRLPIPGDALFRLALLRSIRAAVVVLLPCVVGASAFLWIDWSVATRHLTLAIIAFLWAGLLGPAASLAAGTIVASDKAQALLDSMGGEFQAPKTTWLGLLPGLAATGFVLLAIACADWMLSDATATAMGPASAVLAAAAALPVILCLWALRGGHHALAAVREVSALDQERLAHVERVQPSRLESSFGQLILGAASQWVYRKDVRLSRRRFPVPYFLAVTGVLALWLIAVFDSSSMTWAISISGGLGVYGIVMARRRWASPIEHARFLSTLAVSPASARAAKRGQTLLWFLAYPVLGGVPVVVRSSASLASGAILGAITGACLLVALLSSE